MSKDAKFFYGFKLHRYYKNCTVFQFCNTSKKLVGTHTRTVNAEVPKHERGPHLGKFLKSFGLTLN